MTKDSPDTLPTALFVTFGCKLNFAETASIARELELHGIHEARDGDIPQIIVVNTCSVTAVADRKCRQSIRSLHKRYPHAAIFVTGCYAQLKAEEVRALPGVAMVTGNDKKSQTATFILNHCKNINVEAEIVPARDFRNFEHSCSRGNRTRYFLKVQDGCNYYCTYCTIPYARGRSRSPQIAELVDMAHQVAEAGGKEIVLTGVNVGDFGWQRDDTFLDLIGRLDEVDGIERFRISSIEPNLLTQSIVEFVAHSRAFMPHFHIPLQCGDDSVLKLMRRHYDTALFADRVHLIRRLIPHAFIGVDLIVGMRGETEELFDNSMSFVNSLDISRLHVFPYSERPGTKALEIEPAVGSNEKKRRLQAMLAVSSSKEKAFYTRFATTSRKVLFETFDERTHTLTGHTDNYLKVLAPAPDGSLINHIVNVELGYPVAESGEEYHATGSIVQEP